MFVIGLLAYCETEPNNTLQPAGSLHLGATMAMEPVHSDQHGDGLRSHGREYGTLPVKNSFWWLSGSSASFSFEYENDGNNYIIMGFSERFSLFKDIIPFFEFELPSIVNKQVR